MMKRRATIGVVVTSAFLGCKSRAPMSAVPDSTPTSLGVVDEQRIRVAQLFPAFGGVYVEDNQTVFVLTDPATLDSVKAAWVRVVGALPYGPTRAVKGRYSYTALAGWRNRLMPQTLPLRCSIGIDERANVIHLGCPDSATIATARREADKVKIPNDAVSIRLEAPRRVF
jgi:hypothetical protein